MRHQSEGLEETGVRSDNRGGGRGGEGGVLGVVLAGGESRRFGGEKALFPLGGRPMAAWALDALEPSSDLRVVVAKDPDLPGVLGVPGRPDILPGLGPLGGLLTALTWAEEENLGRVFLLACDLPLVGPILVSRILALWPRGAAAVVPSSEGPRGFEPLCGGYGVECLPAVKDLVASSDRAMEGLLDHVGATRIPQPDLGEPLDLALAFLNVNTRETARRADEILGRSP